MRYQEMQYSLLQHVKHKGTQLAFAWTVSLSCLMFGITANTQEAKSDDYIAGIESLKQENATSRKSVVNQKGDSQNFRIQKLEFKKAKLVDVMRTISEISDINIVPTKEAGEAEITVYLRNVTVHEAVDTISRSNGFWYRQDKISKAYRVMTTKEYQSDMVVFREDTTEIFNLLHPNPVIVATAIRDIYGSRVIFSLGVEDETTINGIAGRASSSTRSTSGGGNGGLNSAASQNSSRAFTSRQTGGSARAGLNRPSESLFDERLTADQLSLLDDALAQNANGEAVLSTAIQRISRTEQPIYVTVNREHNLIIVRTSDINVMNEIRRLIKEMDRPTPQVLLEMKVLELTSGNSFKQVFSLSGVSGDGNESLGLGNFPAEGGTLVYNYINSVISARLELLESKNQINTLSSPVLLASNNKPSQVFVGEERVVVTGADFLPALFGGNGNLVQPSRVLLTTEIRNIGNTLNILPKINADKTVTLMIEQDTSSIIRNGGTLPVPTDNDVAQVLIDVVRTSNIQATVVAKDGLTVAIGGLIRHTDSDDIKKVPLLGDIPVLGQLFQRKEQIKSQSELVLLITPRIITNPSDSQKVSDELMEDASAQSW